MHAPDRGNIGPLGRADAGEIEVNDPPRPQRRSPGQLRRSQHLLATTIQREYGVRRARTQVVIMRQAGDRLAAEHRGDTRRRHALDLFGRGVSGIQPDVDLRHGLQQGAQDGAVIAGTRDGIQIGNVQGPDGAKRHQCARHRQRFIRAAQARGERGIVPAIAAPCVHHEAAFQIDDGYDFHGGGCCGC